MVDIDTRLKNLIGKNRQITQTYIEKAKAIKEEKKRLEENSHQPILASETAGKEETKTGSAEETKKKSGDVAAAPDKGAVEASQLIVDEKPHLAHAGSLLDHDDGVKDADASSSSKEEAGEAGDSLAADKVHFKAISNMNRLIAEESSDSYAAVERDNKESAPDKEIFGDDKEVEVVSNARK